VENFWEVATGADAESSDPDIDYDADSASDFFSYDLGQILSHLDRFPNLKNLCVQVECFWDSFQVGMIEHMFRCRRKSPWPVLELTARSFDAISRNPPGTFISLQLPWFGLVATEAFEQHRWHQIMAQLKHFYFSWPDLFDEIQYLHSHNGFNTSYITTHFYSHLEAIENFQIESNAGCVTGETCGDRDQMQIAPTHRVQGYLRMGPRETPDMPWLRRVHFSWMGLDAELVEFMVSRLDRLEIIELDNCIARQETSRIWDWDGWEILDDEGEEVDEEEDRGMWYQFLKLISESEPKRLRSFQLPSIREWNELIQVRNQSEDQLRPGEAEVLKLIEPAWENEDRLFMFGERSLEYGDMEFSNGFMAKVAIERTEQKAYERVMEFVESNARGWSKMERP
jgi:hypothetical protein